MFQVVHAHFETVLGQLRAQVGWHAVGAFGDEVEGGTEAQFHLQLHKGAAFIEAGRSFDIVGKDDGKFLSLRPARPTLRWPLGAWHDRPDVGYLRPTPQSEMATDRHPHRFGHERLYAVVDSVTKHAGEGRVAREDRTVDDWSVVRSRSSVLRPASGQTRHPAAEGDRCGLC